MNNMERGLVTFFRHSAWMALVGAFFLSTSESAAVVNGGFEGGGAPWRSKSTGAPVGCSEPAAVPAGPINDIGFLGLRNNAAGCGNSEFFQVFQPCPPVVENSHCKVTFRYHITLQPNEMAAAILGDAAGKSGFKFSNNTARAKKFKGTGTLSRPDCETAKKISFHLWRAAGGLFSRFAIDNVVCICVLAGPEDDVPGAKKIESDSDLPPGYDNTDLDPMGGSPLLELATLPNDCNTNGIADVIDVAEGTIPDCNQNGEPDSCDIASGASQDQDANGVPDECGIPTVSEWGLIIMTVLALTAGTIMFGRRRRPAAA